MTASLDRDDSGDDCRNNRILIVANHENVIVDGKSVARAKLERHAPNAGQRENDRQMIILAKLRFLLWLLSGDSNANSRWQLDDLVLRCDEAVLDEEPEARRDRLPRAILSGYHHDGGAGLLDERAGIRID